MERSFMKKIVLIVLLGSIVALTMMGLVSCGHVHAFTQEIVDSAYSASEATCTAKATYYKSCVCGEKGTETFEVGELLSHAFTQEIVDSAYSASEATCTAKATYYKSCVCGEKGTETFEAGELLSHAFTQEVIDDKYKASDATSTEGATYFKSCACGEAGTETFRDTRVLHTVVYEEAQGGSLDGQTQQTVLTGESGAVVTAVPDEDYEFVEWSDGVLTASRQDTNVQGNLTVRPIFREKEYQVTYSARIENHTYFNEDVSGLYSESVTYTAQDIVGYRFVEWSDGNTSPTRTDTKSSDKQEYTAIYEIEPLDLPIIEIVTEEYLPIVSKEEYVGCLVSISNTEEDYCMTEVEAGIRGRGNTTWTLPKKPYRIKFDKKQSLFGSEYKAKSWTLINNYLDKTLSRNALAQEMAEQFDDIAFASMHQFVEVYLNGEYLGVYLLCDQMQTGDGRVDVDEDYADDGNNGYLVELDGRAPSEGEKNVDYFSIDSSHYAIKTPDTEDEDYNPEIQLNYIKNYMESCMTALKNQDWDEICALMDMDSFVDVYIVLEMFGPVDCGWTSVYFYKDKDGKLFSGPVWDFDLSSGNVNYSFGTAASCPPDTKLYVSQVNPWYAQLCKMEEFRAMVAEKLLQYESEIASVCALADPENEDGYYLQYKNSLTRNFKRWNMLYNWLGTEPDDVRRIYSLKGQFDFLSNWLEQRYVFLCEQYGVTLSE